MSDLSVGDGVVMEIKGIELAGRLLDAIEELPYWASQELRRVHNLGIPLARMLDAGLASGATDEGIEQMSKALLTIRDAATYPDLRTFMADGWDKKTAIRAMWDHIDARTVARYTEGG